MNHDDNYFGLSQSVPMGDQTILFRSVLPRKDKTHMALDMAEAGLVFDDDLGLAYESYTSELVLAICMMRYYTDFDLSEYDGIDKWYELYDLLASFGVLEHLYGCLASDMEKVKAIYEKIKASASKTFEHRHSVGFLARKSFGSLLSTEDITKTIAEASDVNSTMIDLLGAFAKVQSPEKLVDTGLLKFGKKIPAKM